LRFDRQKPSAHAFKSLAFYRIFLGHDDFKRVVETQVFGLVGMVIGKRVFDYLETEPAQLLEKSLWMGDARDGVHTLTAKL
jgi:hypothetical protein